MRMPRLAPLGIVVLTCTFSPAQPKPDYVKKATRAETAKATLASFDLPNLSGKWYFAGPFDNPDRKGIDVKYPPEKEVDLKATFVGKNDGFGVEMENKGTVTVQIDGKQYSGDFEEKAEPKK